MNAQRKKAYADIVKRKCEECKEWFMPDYPEQVDCTPRCHIIIGIERAKEAKAERMRKTNKIIYDTEEARRIQAKKA